jgi:hypothetical protein
MSRGRSCVWQALQGCAGTVTRRPNVCAGCCSQVSVRLEFGSCAYVSSLLIGTRALAILGLRSLRGLISGKVILDHLGRQALGAFLSPFQACQPSRTPSSEGGFRPPSPHLLFRRTASRGAGRSRPSEPAYWRARRRACFDTYAPPLASAGRGHRAIAAARGAALPSCATGPG